MGFSIYAPELYHKIGKNETVQILEAYKEFGELQHAIAIRLKNRLLLRTSFYYAAKHIVSHFERFVFDVVKYIDISRVVAL